MKTATIAAVATPPGIGGVGIIKISGPEALKIAATLFRSRKNDKNTRKTDRGDFLPTNFQSHRLYYGHIVDPETENNADEVLLAVMRAPRSYTREDVIEIQAHGGAAALSVILELVLRQGARIAEPGEFTQRAFMNGRIDLTQAEAVIDIINAKTETALKIATNQVSGQLKLAVENIRSILLDVLVHIEAAIDFPEDVSEILTSNVLEAKLQREVAVPIVDLMRQLQGRLHLSGRIETGHCRTAQCWEIEFVELPVEKGAGHCQPTPGYDTGSHRGQFPSAGCSGDDHRYGRAARSRGSG